jgi:hypothetical protein
MSCVSHSVFLYMTCAVASISKVASPRGYILCGLLYEQGMRVFLMAALFILLAHIDKERERDKILEGLANWLEEWSITEMINKAMDRNGWRYMTANFCRQGK